MSGKVKYGNSMLKKTSALLLATLISGCTVLPGIQNLSTNGMKQSVTRTQIEVHPVLIPITPSLVAILPNALYVYKVAPADVLNITVWQHPEFNPVEYRSAATVGPSTQGAAGQSGYLVNPNGNIYFPLIGYVHVAGKTVDEIRVVIANKLKRYVTSPQLNVRVGDFRGRKIYVFGEVVRPGFIPLNDQPLTITDALIMSGSIDPNAADPGHIYVIRGELSHPNIYWLNSRQPDGLLLAEHFNLLPGDILYVSSALATQWNRVINQLLPTIQTVWYTKAIVGN